MTLQIKPFGTWPGAISPKAIANEMRINDTQWDNGEADRLVWIENRGAGGVLVTQSGVDAPRDLTDAELSVRGGVGYGGGEFAVAYGHVYFVAKGRLYRQSLDKGGARPITPLFGSAAAPAVSPDGNWVLFVHSVDRVDGLAIVDSKGEMWPRKLAYGTDFVMQPVWNLRGTQIAYITWNHPLMPWNGTELRLLTLETDPTGVPYSTSIETVVGDAKTAIFQPEFSGDGRYLSYISDETGFGQLYVYNLVEKTHTRLTFSQAEHGKPAWVQGGRVYGWNKDSSAIFYIENQQGFSTLWRYDVLRGTAAKVNGLEDYTFFNQIAVSPHDETIACIASSSTIPTRILRFSSSAGVRIHRRASTENTIGTELAQAQAIIWQGHDGDDVHGLYYPPTSTRFEGSGVPPLMVLVHGGPTSQRPASYDAEAQFFATRGWAVLQVNHRGSTGYGKAYMDKHAGKWGVYDVEDAATGARYLVTKGLADQDKIVILGGSAGGYTVLQSLVDKPGFYKAGVCLYGISNQFMLAMDTHKFEERYSDWLLGPLPEAAAVWRDRSPIFKADKIRDAIIIFQGEDDEVVPKNQSDMIVNSLRSRGVSHEYHIYAGEGHGFRKPETIEDYYNKVMRFLLQHVVYA